MSWWALAAPVAVTAALYLVPGWGLLRAAGVRGLLALGGAPALSAAYLGVAGFVLDRAGIAWGWGPVVAGLVPLVGVAGACGWWVRRAAARRGLVPGGPWSREHGLGRRRSLALTGALALSAATFLVPYLVGLGAPDAVVQQWDAVFHASGVQLVRDTGNASVLGAMQGQYGAAAPGVYYPVVWHAVAALAPGSVALVMNASVVVLGAGVWLLGLAALGRALGAGLGGRGGAWSLAVWTPVLGAAFGHFPSRILVELSQFPLGLSLAVLPGALALCCAAVRSAPGELAVSSGARWGVSALVLATAVAGVAFAHGAGLFSLLLVLAPAVLLRLVRVVRHRWVTGRRRSAVVVCFVVVLAFLLGAVLVLTNPAVRAVASYTYDVHDFVGVTLYRALFDLPTAPVVPGLWPLAVLVVLGAVVVARRRELAGARWLVWSAGAVLVVAAAAAGGLGPLRVLGGPWYSQVPRIVAVLPVVAAPLAVFGLLAAARWAHARVPLVRRAGARVARALRAGSPHVGVAVVLVVVALVVTVGWSAPWKAERGGRYTLPEPIQWGTMLSAEELALIERLDRTTPADAVILGDPANGAAFAYSLAQRRVVFPQLDPSNQSPAQRTLRFGFHRLATEPAVCEAVRELGVTHFYQDVTTVDEGAKVSEDWPGLTTPVTPDRLVGLRQVDTTPDGRATLYELTACPPPAPAK